MKIKFGANNSMKKVASKKKAIAMKKLAMVVVWNTNLEVKLAPHLEPMHGAVAMQKF